jgi:hypothetical protein
MCWFVGLVFVPSVVLVCFEQGQTGIHLLSLCVQPCCPPIWRDLLPTHDNNGTHFSAPQGQLPTLRPRLRERTKVKSGPMYCDETEISQPEALEPSRPPKASRQKPSFSRVTVAGAFTATILGLRLLLVQHTRTAFPSLCR